MGANSYYKKYIEKLIKTCPTSIVIKRTVVEDDGFGGKVETPVELPPQEVAFYRKQAQRIILQDKGETVAHGAGAMKMLARGDADVLEGDTFEHEGKTLRVALLADYGGVCKQAELEAIG
ncbi:MAG: hypothetical protein WAP36_06155 [Halanaerobiales bacterium]